MSNTEFYLTMGGGIVLAFLIAWGIVAWAERQHCDRVDGGYKCHGDNCEGCYRLVGGHVVYENPQPMNDWGDAPLKYGQGAA